MSTLSVQSITGVTQFDFSNTTFANAYSVANSGYVVANAAFAYGNSSYTVANAAFGKANTALQNTSGTFAGTLSTSGGISVTGNMASISPSSIGVYLGRDSGAANNAGIDISCSPTGYGWLDFNNSSSIDYKGRIGYDIGNDIMHLVTNGIIRQQIDSAGRVTNQFQPAFNATSPYTTTTTLWPNNSADFINYQSVHLNRGSSFNATNGRFTAPVAGAYYFTAMMSASTDSSNNTLNDYSFVINGTSNENYSPPVVMNYSISAGQWQTATLSVVLNLSANDYVALRRGCCNNNKPASFRMNFSGFLIG